MIRRRVGRLLGAAAVAATVGVLCTAPVAHAQEAGTGSLRVRAIDSTDPKDVKVTFLWTGAGTDLGGLTLREGGQQKKITSVTELSKTEANLGTVYLVDVSGSMSDDGALAAAQAGIRAQVAELPQGDEAAIVSFSDKVVVESGFTSDVDQLTEAVDELAAPRDGKTATWDGVRMAASLFDDRPNLQPNVVLVTDGNSDVSTATAADAQADLVSSGAALFAVNLQHAGGADGGPIDSIIGRTGGMVVADSDELSAADAFAEVGKTLRGQYVANYASDEVQGSVKIQLAVGDTETSASFVVGSSVSGAAVAEVVPIQKAFGPAWMRNQSIALVGVTVCGLAVGLGAYAVANLAGRSDDSLQSVLSPYSEGGAPVDEHDGALAQTALLQRAVEITEDFAQRQGFLVKVEGALERADLPLRAAEAMFFYAAAAVILTLASLLLGGVVMGLFIGLLAVMLPPAVVNFLAARRGKKFQSLLPDTLQLLSGSLRAGYSLLQGVEAVSTEVGEPMGKELRRVITEARLGREIEDAMEAVAERMASPDFAWAVMAVRIQREVGGNLSELLLTVSDTMVHRERLRRDIAALTAEGKISAIILGLLPIGLGAFMWMSNGEYMHPLGTTGLGQALLGVATVSLLIGFAWMKKIIAIEI